MLEQFFLQLSLSGLHWNLFVWSLKIKSLQETATQIDKGSAWFNEQ